MLHKQGSGRLGNLWRKPAEVLASSRVLREFTVATEVTPLALHWTMCMAAELQPTYISRLVFKKCFECEKNSLEVVLAVRTPTQLSPRDCLPPGLASPRVIPGNLSCSVISISTPLPLTSPPHRWWHRLTGSAHWVGRRLAGHWCLWPPGPPAATAGADQVGAEGTTPAAYPLTVP